MSDYFLNNRIKKGKIAGLCYSAFREGQSFVTKLHPTADQVREDFALIKNCRNIRLYSLHGPNNLAEIAGEFKLNVSQGIWIDRNILRNKKEIALGIERCKYVKSIKAVTVGNEVIKKKYMSRQVLIDHIREVKKEIKLPVSTSEHPKEWLLNPELAKEIDFMALNIFPFWDGVAIDDSIVYFQDKIKRLVEKYPGLEIVINDTGWPSFGQTVKKAIPSLENQKKYLDYVTTYCNKNKIQYYFFEAFDESWKRMAEGEVGAHWGIYNQDRIAKF
jgi:exo-beta-1,3-glucanase (GH17 family)